MPWVGMELPVDEVDFALFATATRVTINNGRTASFWWSSWLDGNAPALLFPLLFKHSKRKNRTVAEAISEEQWIRDVSYDLTVPILDEFVRLWGLIEDVHFDTSNPEMDTIIWTRTATGEYTARSAYDMQFEGGLLSLFPKMVWKVWAPSRCKFFMWLMLTADRLLLREWPNCYFCQLCCRNLETAVHLFRDCPVSRFIWAEISTWGHSPGLNPATWTTTGDLTSWFFDLVGNATSPEARGGPFTCNTGGLVNLV